MITLDDLAAICRMTKRERLSVFIDPINDAMREFQIDNGLREAAFIAQVAHESAGFHYLRELASGDAYEGRRELGNTESGDGRKYKGRGLIQTTGRANYQQCGDALGVDLINSPETLESPVMACRSAAWFWRKHGCNELADKGDFVMITKRINGGLNGYKERLSYYQRAQAVMV